MWTIQYSLRPHRSFGHRPSFTPPLIAFVSLYCRHWSNFTDNKIVNVLRFMVQLMYQCILCSYAAVVRLANQWTRFKIRFVQCGADDERRDSDVDVVSLLLKHIANVIRRDSDVCHFVGIRTFPPWTFFALWDIPPRYITPDYHNLNVKIAF